MTTKTGRVSVGAIKGNLRLVWSHGGQRYFFALGLKDDSLNRKAAEIKARQIEMDLTSGNFDPTLKKYKPADQRSDQIAIALLFSKFTAWKAKRVFKRTLEKYHALHGCLTEFFKDRKAESLKERDIERFTAWMGDRIAPVTLKEYVGLMRACWAWGEKQGLVNGENLWKEVKIKVPPKQPPRPFTKDEVRQIIRGFRNHPAYCHYTDYVEFLFGTGCRTGEAIALRWKHVADDCTSVWIGESMSRGTRKATKTNQARTVTPSPRLQRILSDRRGDDFDPDGFVFPAPHGGSLDDHNFRNRAWKAVLEKVGVEYRKPYLSRSTVVSHMLDEGRSPGAIAELTGHSVKVILTSYAGNIKGRFVMPDLMDED